MRAVGSDIIDAAVARGATALLESEAKDLLRAYGVAVPAGGEASDGAAAVRLARDIGFPVVLKALSREILHKTDAGLVFLGLTDQAEVAAAYQQVRLRGGSAVESILVERMVPGRRELVVGIARDPQFGPVLMFGLGGLLTEALDDVVFAIPPLGPGDAEEMLLSIRAQKLLGAFRGEPVADRDGLARLLEAVGRMAMEHPEIVEVDLNPVILSGGRPVAVDALVTLGPPQVPSVKSAIDTKTLATLLSPGSVAVVGASNDPVSWGGSIMTNLISGGFPGAIYPVSLKADSVFGRPAHKSVADLPEAPDVALIAVPAKQVLRVLDDCGRKGVRAAVVVTAGFGELGAKGREAESELAAVGAKYGMAVIGPNCMGVVSSWARFFGVGAALVHPGPSPAGLVSQSGNAGVQMMVSAERRGAGLGTFVSSGNEAMVTMPDMLDYFAEDPRTQVVAAYIEGFTDGRRLLESTRRVTARKPFVVLRAATGAAGQSAASSHTGAMAASQRVFAGFARQSGMVTTFDPDEFLDLIMAFSYVPLPRGPRVAVISMGGGWAVLSADEVERSGLTLAEFPPSLLGKLDGLLPSFWSHANPVDLVATVAEGAVEQVIEAVAACDAVDALVVSGVVSVMSLMEGILREAHRLEKAGVVRLDHREMADPGSFAARQTAFTSRMVELMERFGKPILAVAAIPSAKTVYAAEGDPEGPRRLVVISSPVRAVRVMAELARYADFRRRVPGA